jgi:hypothetical protein
LFNEVELRVELGEEQNIEATLATMFLKEKSDALKVRLGVKRSANAAVSTTGRATEAGTLPFQIACLITEPPLLEDQVHPFEEAGKFMAIGEVEQVGRPICEGSSGHLNLLHHLT